MTKRFKARPDSGASHTDGDQRQDLSDSFVFYQVPTDIFHCFSDFCLDFFAFSLLLIRSVHIIYSFGLIEAFDPWKWTLPKPAGFPHIFLNPSIFQSLFRPHGCWSLSQLLYTWGGVYPAEFPSITESHFNQCKSLKDIFQNSDLCFIKLYFLIPRNDRKMSKSFFLPFLAPQIRTNPWIVVTLKLKMQVLPV